MTQVNMLEAKTRLSKLVEAVETGKEAEVILARNGKPVARIVPLAQPVVDTSKRLGIGAGLFGNLDQYLKELKEDRKQMTKQFYARQLTPNYESVEPAKRRKKV